MPFFILFFFFLFASFLYFLDVWSLNFSTIYLVKFASVRIPLAPVSDHDTGHPRQQIPCKTGAGPATNDMPLVMMATQAIAYSIFSSSSEGHVGDEDGRPGEARNKGEAGDSLREREWGHSPAWAKALETFQGHFFGRFGRFEGGLGSRSVERSRWVRQERLFGRETVQGRIRGNQEKSRRHFVIPHEPRPKDMLRPHSGRK